MLKSGVTDAHKYPFERCRWVGVVGREAYHVFDLKKMEFVYAERELGYSKLQPV